MALMMVAIPAFDLAREQVRAVFERWRARTKFEIAEVIARNLTELEPLMYPRHRYPEREGNYEALFTAISMAITHFFRDS